MKFHTIRLLFVAVLLGGAAPTDYDVPQITPGQPVWSLESVLEAQRLRDAPVPKTPTPFEGAPVNLLNSTVTEATPASLPQLLSNTNTVGIGASYIPSGPITVPASKGFFQPLGSNGRTCQTCHQPANGWSITPSAIKTLFQSSPSAPLFRTVDGAVCGNADTTTATAAAAAYRLLLTKGLIRVFIPLPAPPTLQFAVTSVADPYNCTNNPATGLTSPTKGIVSVYRRPLPSTNLSFIAGFMWDGREPTLESQVKDAVAIHAQGITPPSDAQIADVVAFETGIYSAQSLVSAVGTLSDKGAQGGPVFLPTTPFHAGINDVLGADPAGTAFNPAAMALFMTWNGDSDPSRAAVARGQNLFNSKPITITGVSGLNDLPGHTTVAGTCTSCHDTPNVGSHSTKFPINIGVTAAAPAGLDVAGLPVFTLICNSGPLAGQVFQVTDPGKALISGQCADIGKTKGPVLRNLAARPPYFHNGSAVDLATVIEFYNTRFNIGFTAAEKADLLAFLNAL